MNNIPILNCADGAAIPRLGQGTWYLGKKPATRTSEVKALQCGIEHGLPLIDTAEMYGEGLAEKMIAEAIASYDRDKQFLVFKVYPWNAGKNHISHACENTLRRMKTDDLDMYLLHWRGSVPLKETAECMEKLVHRGLIRRWGISNLHLEDMKELWESDAGRHCQTNQILYHLASRGVKTVLLPWLRRQNISLMAYCPLAQGGTLRPKLLRHPVLQEMAAEEHCAVSQLMLAFFLSKPSVIAILRSGNAAHTAENAAVAEVILSQNHLDRLDVACPAPRRREPLDIM